MTDTEITQSTEKEPPAPPKHPWAELRPDRFRLLRLAPLPTERDGGARPLRFVELAQLERHTPEQSLLRMFVNIPGQARSRKYNVLEVWADHRSKELRFGPDSGLHLEPANRGLGRFLLDHLARGRNIAADPLCRLAACQRHHGKNGAKADQGLLHPSTPLHDLRRNAVWRSGFRKVRRRRRTTGRHWHRG